MDYLRLDVVGLTNKRQSFNEYQFLPPHSWEALSAPRGRLWFHVKAILDVIVCF